MLFAADERILVITNRSGPSVVVLRYGEAVVKLTVIRVDCFHLTYPELFFYGWRQLTVQELPISCASL